MIIEEGLGYEEIITEDDEVYSCAMRGRDPENPNNREAGSNLEQRLEISKEPYISNAVTSVSKDNYILREEPLNTEEDGTCRTIKAQYYKTSGANFNRTADFGATGVIRNDYRIRKLTPRETWRVMNCSDSDFDKAQAVNSNTKLYSQAGNAIVVNVLTALFGQMFEGKESVYKEYANKLIR